MKALLIEDDRAIGNLLADALTQHHWVVDRAFDGVLNPRQIYSRRAIRDHLWNFAHASSEETVSTHGLMNGSSVTAEQIEAATQDVEFLQQAIAKAYTAGADDYISKTLSATELVTRILYRVGMR